MLIRYPFSVLYCQGVYIEIVWKLNTSQILFKCHFHLHHSRRWYGRNKSWSTHTEFQMSCCIFNFYFALRMINFVLCQQMSIYCRGIRGLCLLWNDQRGTLNKWDRGKTKAVIGECDKFRPRKSENFLSCSVGALWKNSGFNVVTTVCNFILATNTPLQKSAQE